MWQQTLNNFFTLFKYDSKNPLIFSSGFFLFLFACFMGIYLVLHKQHRSKIIFVTLFSLYFYYKSSGIYFLLLVSCTCIDYFLANKIALAINSFYRKIFLVLSLISNLGVLFYFKYTNFFLQIFNDISAQHYETFAIFLPVGVSFFTFQSLSYTIDVYRKNIKPVKNILDYAFYLSFFPQLVAGPIVRAVDFIPQIYQKIVVSKEMLGRGLFLIISGLFKKAVIADYIGVNFVDRVFENPMLYSGLENLMAIYGYAIQIYCDFSGYSDMAIGIALLMGFHFNLNFDSPYQSKNITEFWRRWHISLSSWLKDYLYIGLGGNRKGKIRTYFNLLITMLIGGLWHGAALRFIVWGALHGAALAFHKLFLAIFNKVTPIKIGKAIWIVNLIKIFFTFNFICFCWIFFRAENMEIASQMMQQIIHNFKAHIILEFLVGYKTAIILIAIGYFLHFIPYKYEQWCQAATAKLHWSLQSLALLAMILLVVQFKSADIQPFIYFQF